MGLRANSPRLLVFRGTRSESSIPVHFRSLFFEQSRYWAFFMSEAARSHLWSHHGVATVESCDRPLPRPRRKMGVAHGHRDRCVTAQRLNLRDGGLRSKLRDIDRIATLSLRPLAVAS